MLIAARIIITLNAAIFLIVLPLLEVSATHIFNVDWPGHARLHNVWQLITNAALAALATWLAWRRRDIAMALLLSTILSGSFLAAFAMQELYGGTMQHSDGTELLINGVNPAVGLLTALTLAQLGLLALRPRKKT